MGYTGIVMGKIMWYIQLNTFLFISIIFTIGTSKSQGFYIKISIDYWIDIQVAKKNQMMAKNNVNNFD